MKWILGALVVLLILLQYEFWVSDGGMKTVWRLKKEIAHQQDINATLAKQNDALAINIRHLKKGHEAVESRARNQLGMIKKNETFYRVVK